MSRKFLTPIDLGKNELQNAVVQNLGSAPSAPVKGQIYMDSTANILYWYNGTIWVAAQPGAGASLATTVTTQAVGDAGVVGTSANVAREDHKHGREAFGNVTAINNYGLASANGSAATVARADHNHGSPLHDDTAHNAVHLNWLAAPTGTVGMGNQKIGSVADPTLATDAATKQYVDNIAAGLSWKASVRAASTGTSVVSNGPQTVDNVPLVVGERVLLKDQGGGGIANGIYVVAAGAWNRATDADASAELLGMAVFVTEGSVNGDTAWVCVTNAPITLNTTPLAFAQFAGGGAVIAGAGMTQSGNTLNVIGDTTMIIGADIIGQAPLTGDVTTPAGSTVATIAAGAVTSAKMANMPAYTVKGNLTASTAVPTDLTIAAMQSIMGYTKRFGANSTAGTTTVVNHNLNNRLVIVVVFRNSAPYDEVECDVEHTDTLNVTVRFAVAVAASEYTIAVFG